MAIDRRGNEHAPIVNLKAVGDCHDAAPPVFGEHPLGVGTTRPVHVAEAVVCDEVLGMVGNPRQPLTLADSLSFQTGTAPANQISVQFSE